MTTCNCSKQNCTCDSTLTEHISKILSKSKYKLNEATYKLVDNIDEDDNIPDEVYKEPKPMTGNDQTAFEGDQNAGEQPTDEPLNDPATADALSATELPSDDPIAPMEQEKSPDQVQNDILKLNISAMEKMQNAINALDSTVDTINMSLSGLNKKISTLSHDVEEVREPTNVEKLIRKTDDSHPFHYNLADMWKGSSFQGRRDYANDGQGDLGYGENKGIKQLEDGSYIADFDALQKHTERDIKDSFKEY